MSAEQLMPTLFIGHGSPLNLILDNDFTKSLKELGQNLPKPTAILSISSHWETFGTQVLSVSKPRIIYDFMGFPAELYKIPYPAVGAPQLAEQIVPILAPITSVKLAQNWGLDHGTWTVLYHLFPQADIPVVQLSINYNLSLIKHYKIGALLRSLREIGVLIIGSGNLVHNLRLAKPEENAEPFDWAVEFDQKIEEAILARDTNVILNPEQHLDEIALTAHPSMDHYIPLLYAMGASDEKDPISFPYKGFQYGSISMKTIKFGS